MAQPFLIFRINHLISNLELHHRAVVFILQLLVPFLFVVDGMFVPKGDQHDDDHSSGPHAPFLNGAQKMDAGESLADEGPEPSRLFLLVGVNVLILVHFGVKG